MSMTSVPSPLSIRLSVQTRERLDRAVTRLRRSRSYLIQEAVDKYLDAVEKQPSLNTQARYTKLLSLAGAGAHNGGRSKEEIDASIRWLRGDE